MKENNKTYKLPIKKLPLLASMRIRMRLFFKAHRFAFSLQRLAVGTLIVAIVATGSNYGVRAYAYNATSVTPGHILYDLRRDIETEKLEDITDPKERAEQYITYAERRVDEAEYIIENDSSSISLIPKAKAQEEEEVEVTIPENSTVSELLVESSNLENLALEELNKIEDVDSIEDISAKIEKHQKRNTTLLNRIQNTTSKEELKQLMNILKENGDINSEEIRKLKEDIRNAREEGTTHIRREVPSRWLKGKNENSTFPRQHLKKIRQLHKLRSKDNTGDQTSPPQRERVPSEIREQIHEKDEEFRREDAPIETRDESLREQMEELRPLLRQEIQEGTQQKIRRDISEEEPLRERRIRQEREGDRQELRIP